MAMDKVGGENLYIGGMLALRGREALKGAGITHVVSVLWLPLDRQLFVDYQHKIIEVDDAERENLLEHFAESNKFISDALKGGGAVLIHCAAGRSRSATILTAYLMASRRLAPNLALGIIKRSRPLVEPNPGFMRQLELYHQMEYAENVEDHPVYQRWMYMRDVGMSNAAGRAPKIIHFRDVEAGEGGMARIKEGEIPEEKDEIHLRCRVCRTVLACSAVFTPHLPKPTQPPHSQAPRQPCAHHFVQPLSWMKPELSRGEVAGKLECPQCQSKVGTYAWQGLKCSCGDWIVPGISLARGKVDMVSVKL